jgi:hypothetical protein
MRPPVRGESTGKEREGDRLKIWSFGTSGKKKRMHREAPIGAPGFK